MPLCYFCVIALLSHTHKSFLSRPSLIANARSVEKEAGDDKDGGKNAVKESRGGYRKCKKSIERSLLCSLATKRSSASRNLIVRAATSACERLLARPAFVLRYPFTRTHKPHTPHSQSHVAGEV